MSSVLSIAASGMAAASARLAVSARNVANAHSNGKLPETPGEGPAPYAPQRVDQVDVAGGGTAFTVSEESPGFVPVSDPGAPYADENGMVAAPAVDLGREVVAQMVAKYTFMANVAVVRADAQMKKALLDITR